MPSIKRIVIDTRDVLGGMIRFDPSLLVTIPLAILIGLIILPEATLMLSAGLLCLFAWRIQANPDVQRRLAEDREHRS